MEIIQKKRQINFIFAVFAHLRYSFEAYCVVWTEIKSEIRIVLLKASERI